MAKDYDKKFLDICEQLRWDPDVVHAILHPEVRKDPKHKAKQTQVHRDRTKYKRRPKHVRSDSGD